MMEVYSLKWQQRDWVRLGKGNDIVKHQSLLSFGKLQSYRVRIFLTVGVFERDVL